MSVFMSDFFFENIFLVLLTTTTLIASTVFIFLKHTDGKTTLETSGEDLNDLSMIERSLDLILSKKSEKSRVVTSRPRSRSEEVLLFEQVGGNLLKI